MVLLQACSRGTWSICGYGVKNRQGRNLWELNYVSKEGKINLETEGEAKDLLDEECHRTGIAIDAQS